MPLLEAPTFDQLEHRKEILYGNIHREEWRWNGALHSVDNHPSVKIDGAQEWQWHSHGMRHREGDRPAWIKDFGTIQIYYHLNVIHRARGGPAMISDTKQKWYSYGRIHRADGPAIIHNDGHVEWWWKGYEYATMDEWADHGKVDPQLFVLLKLEWG